MHQIDDEFNAGMDERIKMSLDSLPKLIDGVKDRPRSLDILANAARTAAGFCYLLNPHSEKVISSFDISRKSLNALYSCAIHAPNPTMVSFGFDDPIIFVEKPDADSVHVGNWLDGFFLNLVFGDFEAMRQLCRVPTDLLRESPTKGSEFGYLYKDALCAYINAEPDAVRRVIEAMKATDPARPDVVDAFFTLNNSVPQLEVLFYIITADARFSSAMQRAVECHRDYFGVSEETSRNARGYTSIELLGLAVLGMDVGLSFDVDSPYLPMHLICAT